MSSRKVRIFEVGVRDGLQNESRLVSTAQKITLIRSLVSAGVRDLELGSFVRPDLVPQMADTEKLYRAIQKGTLQLKSARAWALVPNAVGLSRALSSGARRIAVFTAATESFAQKNIRMSIAESLAEIKKVTAFARAHGVTVRGYVSTAWGCPFEGRVDPRAALRVVAKLKSFGIEQISIGDTIGVATPGSVQTLVSQAIRQFGAADLGVHFHDTRGTALANALSSLELGIRTIDSSAGGLGGCPFAPGATGNLATEDLVYLLHGMGFKTGIDLSALAQASLKFARSQRLPLQSRYLRAFAANRGPARAEQGR